MKEFMVLRILDRFRNYFSWLGVDYDMMRKILQMKLIMDGRNVPTVLTGSSGKKEENNGFVKSLWIYILMSVAMLPFLLMEKNYMFQMSVVFGILIFMVMASLISDFSSVLLDIRDKSILFSRPVSRKTLSMAKLVHVMIYMFYLTAAFTGIPLIVSLYKHGILFFLIFLAEILLIDLFVVVLTALIYLLVLKIFDGEKLKDIINSVQIALAVGVTVGYQFIGRLFSSSFTSIEFIPKWWEGLIIPVWFAAPFEILLNGSMNTHYIVLALLAVLVPIFAIAAYICLMPEFERNLQKLNNHNGGERKRNRNYLGQISSLICRSRLERVFFRFTFEMIRKEREFKLRVYPILGLSVVMPLVMLFNIFNSSESLDHLNTRLYLMIYFCGMFLPTLLIMSRCSGNYKGAWIYKIIPMPSTAPIFKGTVKAMILNLFVPVFCLGSVIFLVAIGPQIIPGLIAVFLNLMLYIAICFKILKPVLPFSNDFNIKQDDQWVGAALILALFIFAGAQLACTFFSFGIYINIGVIAVANLVMWKKVYEIPWEKLK